MPSSGSSEEYRRKAHRYTTENRKTRRGVTRSTKVARTEADGSPTTPCMSADFECVVDSIQDRNTSSCRFSRERAWPAYFPLRTAEVTNNPRTVHIRDIA